MQISRAIAVLGLEWASLVGGLVAGMAIERCAHAEDIRIILAGVAGLALVAGAAAGRLALADAHECNVGSLLFGLTAAVVNLMMVRDGTDGHLAGSVLCAAAAAAVFHLAATRVGVRLDPAARGGSVGPRGAPGHDQEAA